MFNPHRINQTDNDCNMNILYLAEVILDSTLMIATNLVSVLEYVFVTMKSQLNYD